MKAEAQSRERYYLWRLGEIIEGMEVFSSSIVINEDIIHFLIERKENWLDIFKRNPFKKTCVRSKK